VRIRSIIIGFNEQSSIIYHLAVLLMLHILWLSATLVAYNLFWDELLAMLPMGFDFLVLLTSDLWLAVFNIIRVDSVYFYWSYCSYRGRRCNQHIIHTLNFAGTLIDQVTLLLMTLHFWSMQGLFLPTGTGLFIICLAQSKVKSIIKLVKNYWSYYSVLKRINNTFPVAPLERIKGELCSICREELKPGAKIVPCGHIFDATCLEAWMRMKRECPNCRTSLDLETSSPLRQRQNPVQDNLFGYISRFFMQTFLDRRVPTELSTESLQRLIEIFPERSAQEINQEYRRVGSAEAVVAHFLQTAPQRSAVPIEQRRHDLFRTNPYAQDRVS